MKNIEFYRDKLSDIETTDNVVCKACALMRNKTECIFKIMPTFERKCPNNREIVDFLLSEYTETVKLTDVEKIILECVDGYFNYITRDKDERLFLYETIPCKNEDGVWEEVGNMTCKFFPFTNMFRFISWKDNEPYSIANLLEIGQK